MDASRLGISKPVPKKGGSLSDLMKEPDGTQFLRKGHTSNPLQPILFDSVPQLEHVSIFCFPTPQSIQKSESCLELFEACSPLKPVRPKRPGRPGRPAAGPCAANSPPWSPWAGQWSPDASNQASRTFMVPKKYTMIYPVDIPPALGIAKFTL